MVMDSDHVLQMNTIQGWSDLALSPCNIYLEQISLHNSRFR